MIAERTQLIIERIWSSDNPEEIEIYLVVDAARDDALYGIIRTCNLEWRCLYSGDIPEDLARVAPYLVRLRKENSFTEFILENGWGRSWGIFAGASAGIERLRKHFHSFLTVETEDGNRMLFRYYDPRVFRMYLPTCRADELKTVFGPVRNFILEAEDPLVLSDYRFQSARLSAHQHLLARDDSADLTP